MKNLATEVQTIKDAIKYNLLNKYLVINMFPNAWKYMQVGILDRNLDEQTQEEILTLFNSVTEQMFKINNS